MDIRMPDSKNESFNQEECRTEKGGNLITKADVLPTGWNEVTKEMLQGRFPAAISGLEGGKKEMTENPFHVALF